MFRIHNEGQAHHCMGKSGGQSCPRRKPAPEEDRMNEAFEELARSLANAWRGGGAVPLPPAGAAPASRADAFAIQDRMAELVGDTCVGWKVGAAVPAVQRLEGHDGPIVGRLLASRMFAHPATVPAALFDGYKVECEFAFRFRDGVPARTRAYTRAELLPLLVLHPGLELAGGRYVAARDGRKATTRDAIADNGAGGGYVVGAGIEDWKGIAFEALPLDARTDGGEPIGVYTGELRRDPVDILVETVNGLAERGIGLAAGDLLSTGSLTVPTPLRRGQTYVARFGDLQTLSVTVG
jgi:2-keto-4-pentenoate hydratase